MKMRKGFVSNSSSSSFIVYGTSFEGGEDIFYSLTEDGLALRDKAISSYEDTDEPLSDERKKEILESDPEEILSLFLEEFENMGLDVNNDDYSISIGSSFTSMPLDVTRQDWQKTTQDTLSKYLNVYDFYIIDEVIMS